MWVHVSSIFLFVFEKLSEIVIFFQGPSASAYITYVREEVNNVFGQLCWFWDI